MLTLQIQIPVPLFRGYIADGKYAFARIRTAVVQLPLQPLRYYRLIYLEAEIVFFALQ
jgi:hypothetical protein